MGDVKTTRKIHLVFEQDDNGDFPVSTSEASMKDSSGRRTCCIRINNNHYRV